MRRSVRHDPAAARSGSWVSCGLAHRRSLVLEAARKAWFSGVGERNNIENLSGQGLSSDSCGSRSATARPKHLNTFSAIHLDTRPPAVHRTGQASLRRGRTGSLTGITAKPCNYAPNPTRRSRIMRPSRRRHAGARPLPDPVREESEHPAPTRYPTARRAPNGCPTVSGPRAKTNLLTMCEPVHYPRSVLKRRLRWRAGSGARDRALPGAVNPCGFI